ncbi:MAG: AAA domain-containing protein [Planctomycetota bacterium]
MASNAVLAAMLDRLFASLMSGPSLNCRPHSSRQRIDVASLGRLESERPESLLAGVLGEGRSAKFAGNVPRVEDKDDVDGEASPGARAWKRQVSLLRKLRYLSEDARTYEQDTGVAALFVGYPILSLPPGLMGGGSRRIVAPIALVPVTVEVSTGRSPGVSFTAREHGADLVSENPALMAWLERETGRSGEALFVDEAGEEPRREIAELIAHVAGALDMGGVDGAALSALEEISLEAVPKAEDLPDRAAVLPSAVVGLFPSSKQGLIRDTRELLAAERLDGPVRSFTSAAAAIGGGADDSGASDDDDGAVGESGAEPVEAADVPPRHDAAAAATGAARERFVSRADPCQAATVLDAQSCEAMVIHGPPGTGKSQTITNIIGDHLARGERVLFVCDKRTALDVVANRLEHLGLGDLCAVVHDPQWDQRDLYMAIRGRLEALDSAKSDARAQRRVEKLDVELDRLHGELTTAHGFLMSPDEHGLSLHGLIGRWLELSAPPEEVAAHEAGLAQIGLEGFREHAAEVELVLSRGVSDGFSDNAWAECAGVTLDEFLATPAAELRRRLATCVEDARVVDGAADPCVPAFSDDEPIADQVTRRGRALALLERAGEPAVEAVAGRVWSMQPAETARLTERLSEVQPHLEGMTPLDRELRLALGDSLPGLAKVNQGIADLERYLASTASWLGFLAFGARGAAARVLRDYGLPRTAEHAQRVAAFLRGVKARVLMSDALNALRGGPNGAMVHPDEELAGALGGFAVQLELRAIAGADASLAEPLRAGVERADRRGDVVRGLKLSAARGAAIEALDASTRALGLMDEPSLSKVAAGVRAGRRVLALMQRLSDGFERLEGVLRVSASLAALPEALRPATRACVKMGLTVEEGLLALERGVLSGEIDRRIAASGGAGAFDAHALDEGLRRYAGLAGAKRESVVAAIRHRWLERQRERLLVGTRSRLNSLGARVRQRLYVRGARAMRLRQVVALGRESEYEDGLGDPIFDLCPVWMASPETVAQVFPREAMFDTVIFDEASQCRLEEALPVLTRAKRVVIAGDPKQLPPTRFFESALVSSEDEEIDSDESMFDVVQSEVEDLLAAALNIGVQEAYLDVHYRSRNADLIAFSNEQFYNSRLQAIPGHPANRARHAPVVLREVGGVYDKRCNAVEAERVVDLVDELLSAPEPPSIGVACFSLTQRDTVLDALAARAEADTAFGRRLAAARQRWGEGSFEGLFVKNLESVQGDERDHIVISTTYGPNAEGKFYRRFGPLGRAGGGRRLNVLVTRARERVHLVTSIPQEAYAHADPIPEGASPNGSWLLFAYLRFAARLNDAYRAEEDGAFSADEPMASEVADSGEPEVMEASASVRYLPIEPVSRAAMALGRRLLDERGLGSQVHWGNEGFCVDAAVDHPDDPEDVTVGVLCDFNRFAGTPDPVKWEVYREGILAGLGWSLCRVWSPQVYRDAQGVIRRVAEEAAEVAASGSSGDG